MAKTYLLLAAVGLVPIALSYGVDPASTAPRVFDFTPATTDQFHVLRAVMGLYLGMAAFWLVSAFRAAWRRPAVGSVVCFMVGLAAGRAFSMQADGQPSGALVAGFVVEIVMAVAGAVVLVRDEGAGQ